MDAEIEEVPSREFESVLYVFPIAAHARSSGGPLWRKREDYTRSLLAAEELPLWHKARDKAQEDGVFDDRLALGTKPRAG
jgi:hypothetical protein